MNETSISMTVGELAVLMYADLTASECDNSTTETTTLQGEQNEKNDIATRG